MFDEIVPEGSRRPISSYELSAASGYWIYGVSPTVILHFGRSLIKSSALIGASVGAGVDVWIGVGEDELPLHADKDNEIITPKKKYSTLIFKPLCFLFIVSFSTMQCNNLFSLIKVPVYGINVINTRRNDTSTSSREKVTFMHNWTLVTLIIKQRYNFKLFNLHYIYVYKISQVKTVGYWFYWRVANMDLLKVLPLIKKATHKEVILSWLLVLDEE